MMTTAGVSAFSTSRWQCCMECSCSWVCLQWRGLQVVIIKSDMFIVRYWPSSQFLQPWLMKTVWILHSPQLIQRMTITAMPAKYQPDYIFLRHVPLRRVHLFTAIQVLCLAILWVIKTIKSISIVFPLMVRVVHATPSGSNFLLGWNQL